MPFPSFNSGAVPDDDALASLALHLIAGVGPRTREALLQEFGQPTRILTASFDQLVAVPGVRPTLAREIVAVGVGQAAVEEWQKCCASRIQIIDRSTTVYPRLLTEIPDPPGIIYVRGEILPTDAASIAIVGTRRASYYGLRQAEALASGLAHAGITVVSGLARGIDAAAHRGALQAGGRTIAVLAGGLAEIYPPEHDQLAVHIASHGALMTEAPLRAEPKRGHFPRRNRIISGLSLGVIVVEAAGRSGALVTVRHALEQNREVFAVPGRIDHEGARGCHRLIREGAKLVESVDDVLEELGPLPDAVPGVGDQTVQYPAELRLSAFERSVLETIEREPMSVDQVIDRCQAAVPQVLSTLSILEMRHLIDRISGNLVVRR